MYVILAPNATFLQDLLANFTLGYCPAFRLWYSNAYLVLSAVTGRPVF